MSTSEYFMKLIYKGGFDGNMDSLPAGEHKPGATKFKEWETPTKMAILANVLAMVITLGLIVLLFVYKAMRGAELVNRELFMLGAVASLLTLFPHEILHALCFKDTVHLYTNWSKGMLFVVGTEDMSKARFVFMSLLPNLVFGIIPYILFLIFPGACAPLGIFGAICAGMGAGDYYNVFNALTQMPKGARTYLHKFNSYWYMP